MSLQDDSINSTQIIFECNNTDPPDYLQLAFPDNLIQTYFDHDERKTDTNPLAFLNNNPHQCQVLFTQAMSAPENVFDSKVIDIFDRNRMGRFDSINNIVNLI